MSWQVWYWIHELAGAVPHLQDLGCQALAQLRPARKHHHRAVWVDADVGSLGGDVAVEAAHTQHEGGVVTGRGWRQEAKEPGWMGSVLVREQSRWMEGG